VDAREVYITRAALAWLQTSVHAMALDDDDDDASDFMTTASVLICEMNN
jgi:hypothetical protein